MILNFKAANFTLASGFYYSDPIKIETKDTLLTIEARLSGSGNVSLQQSLSGTTWYDIVDTSFACAPYGMQSFIECQPELLLRLKSSVSFVTADILL